MDPQRPGWTPPAEPMGLTPDVPATPAPVVTGAAPRSRTRTAAVGVLAGVGALALAGTAYAATTAPSPTPSGSSPLAPGPMMGDGDDDGRPGPGRHHGRGGPGMGGPGMGIHGTFVVPDGDGGYRTVHTQGGEVTAVSSTSLTVRSEDGYSQTYVVTADTVVNAQRDGIGSIETGDDVRVLGVETDGAVTAVRISDRTGIKDGMGRFAPPSDDDEDPSTSPSST